MTKFNLWRYSKYFGRSGEVEGIFIATEDEIDNYLVGQEINFGEILGKHSDVDIYFEKSDFECLDVSESTIKDLFRVFGSRTIAGYNPFERLYDYLKCKDCSAEGYLGTDWYRSKDLNKFLSCPECGSSNFIKE